MGMNIEPYRSSKVEVRASALAGRGIFAKERIAAGQAIAIKGGYFLSADEFDALSTECKQYCLQVGDDMFIGPRQKRDIPDCAVYINHSCNPNVGFRGQLTYVAMREIMSGEELTHDYAMCFTDMRQFSNMVCGCGSTKCRTTITGDDWKSPELQELYGNYFAEFILKKIKQSRR